MKKINLFLFLFLVNISNASVYYVLPGGRGEKTGLNWENALDLSTQSLSVGQSGDEFWVGAGEYQVNIEYQDRKLYGGFSGVETDLSQRDWVKNRTILKGVSNASKSLVSMLLSAEIDGFIIEDNQNMTQNGGGIQIRNKGVIRNCIVRNNSVGGANVGGGIFVDGVVVDEVYPTIENCLIINNTCANNGGGIQIANNRALHIINSTIANNKISKATEESGSGFGCGVGLPVNAKMIAENCIVYNNQKPDGTGTLTYSFGTNQNMNNNTISIVRNCAFDGINPGTGTQNSVIFAEKTNCIDNLSLSKGAGFKLPTTFVGAVLNTTNEYMEFSTADYSLVPNSVCIDAGNNEYPTVTKDLAGKERIYNSIIDLGAYEYIPNEPLTKMDNVFSKIDFCKTGNLLLINGLNKDDYLSICNLMGEVIFSTYVKENSIQLELPVNSVYIITLNNYSKKLFF